MKKSLIAIAMLFVLSMNAGAAAQKHRHTPRTEQVDSAKNNQDAIEAFSDTTSTDADKEEQVTYTYSRNVTDEDAKAIKEVLEGVGGVIAPSAAIAIVAIVVMFLLAPLLIIIAIFYFVNKNRKEKYKLAQMAIQNGQPIPDQLLKESQTSVDNDDYQSGLRQMFLGIGLGIFLGIIIGDIGYGIGALIFFIGLGKWYIARKSLNQNNNNPSNMQNYE